MTDAWFRFCSLLLTQGVILAGLYWNRKQSINDSPTDQITEIRRQLTELRETVRELVNRSQK